MTEGSPSALFKARSQFIVKRGTRTFPLAIGCLLIGLLPGEIPRACAAPPILTGAPVAVTPDLFECPLCIFVRSEECPQSFKSTEPACNFLYDYHGADGLYHPVSGDQLFQSLPKDMPVLILIHGSFVDYEEEPELLRTFEWIREGSWGRPLLVLCYRWPSALGCRAILGSIAICQMAQRAEFNGFYLAQLLNQIPVENPVALMGHSHGCRMISAALHLLSGGRVDGKSLNPWSWSNRGFRVSFFSAGIDHDWLNPGERYGLAINRMCWLQNHKHALDWALLTYPLRYPGSSRALGQTGFTGKDIRRLGTQAGKIQEFNGQGALIWGHGLRSHLDNPGIQPWVISNIYSPCCCP
jgi:hypothetical protein